MDADWPDCRSLNEIMEELRADVLVSERCTIYPVIEYVEERPDLTEYLLGLPIMMFYIA